MRAQAHVRRILEVDEVLGLIAQGTRSDLGRLALSRLEPSVDSQDLENRQALLRAYWDFTSQNGDFPWALGLEPVVDRLAEGRHSGFLLGEELLKVRNLLSLALEVRACAEKARETFGPLGYFSGKIGNFENEIAALKVLNSDGSLADSASPKLRQIRESLEEVRHHARRVGNSFLNGSQASMLQERMLALRGGRFAVLVKQSFAGRFPGIVTDRSTSGNSLYMEPHSLVPLNNKLAELAEEQRQEERKILRELTQRLLKRLPAVEDAEEALCRLDMLYGLAEIMSRKKWHLPVVTNRSELDLREVRHPLLGERAVPIHIRCGRDFRALVVTGPNTGGKTVSLKTAALAIYIGWCGLPIPAMEGSQIGCLSSLHVDIGDEQSIEQNLSTFSSHLKRIVAMLEEADRNSLVLLDELGAGTDPQEGAALGIAVLEEFLKKGTLVLATTHHNPIKRFAATTPGVETACVDFDMETLSPTYHLLIGIPGQSNALAIARRWGMPSRIVDRAAQCLDSGEIDAEKLMAQLQEKRVALDKLERDLLEQRNELEKERRSFVASRAASERRRDDMILKAEREAQRVIDEAEAEARSLIKDLNSAAESAAHREMEKHKISIDKSRRRSTVRQRSLEARHAKTDEVPLKVGSTVRLQEGKTVGEILAIDGKNAEVQVGPMRITVPLVKLAAAKPPKSALVDYVPTAKRPEGIPSSVMVRGLTVDEAMPIVENYLDQAMRAGYGEVSVIHGRGEGILRRKVQELCARLPYVAQYRLGDHGEGGYGVTIVRFH